MLIVSLRGVALQQDKFKRQRKELEVTMLRISRMGGEWKIIND